MPIFDKDAKQFNREKTSFFNNSAEATGHG